MSSPDSCFRCSKAAAVLSPSGLCRECAATDATADPTPPESPAPEIDPAGATVTEAPRVPPSAGPTGFPPGSATASAPADGFQVLPESPPGFALVRHLGGGGMGDVYLARESPSGRPVALKFLKRPESPAAYQRFVTELQVLAELDHPNIVGVLSSDFLRATPFFTMPCAAGGSLADVLKPDPDGPPRLPAPAEAVRIIRVIAGAVAAANTKGIVHRDLKPANVLLFGLPGQWDALKVADFGLAKRIGDEDGFTATEDALGTPGYMPPEQVSRANGADGQIDCRADVYGLGATLYHLLTGRAPFVGPTKLDMIAQVLADAPERPRRVRLEIPLALEAIVLKCLAKDPSERYESVPALLAALDRYEQHGRDPDAAQMTWARRARLWTGRHRGPIGAAAAVALVTIAAFALGAAPWRPAPVPGEPPAAGPRPEPPDPLSDLRARLGRGEAVELVGPTGLPAYSRALLETVTVGESPLGDGTCAIHTFDLCLLELWPDPGHDRYRISADVRQLHPRHAVPGVAPTDYVGLYFSYGSGAARGRVAHAAFAVTFEDYPARRDPPTRTVWLRRLGFLLSNNDLLKEDSGKSRSLPFAPAPARPGPWRRIVVDVSPAEVVARWCPTPETKPDALELLGRWPDARWPKETAPAQYDALTAKLAARDPEAARAVPAWSPRMPFGVIASRSSVAIRNVTLTPNP